MTGSALTPGRAADNPGAKHADKTARLHVHSGDNSQRMVIAHLFVF